MFLKKSLGQNLLIDKNIINKILSLSNIKAKNVVEVGPGTGNLTFEILKLGPKSLVCIEKDRQFSEKLNINFKNNNKVKVINEDILKVDFKSFIREDSIILGNLPYNISTQILIKFIRLNPWPPKSLIVLAIFHDAPPPPTFLMRGWRTSCC